MQFQGAGSVHVRPIWLRQASAKVRGLSRIEQDSERGISSTSAAAEEQGSDDLVSQSEPNQLVKQRVFGTGEANGDSTIGAIELLLPSTRHLLTRPSVRLRDEHIRPRHGREMDDVEGGALGDRLTDHVGVDIKVTGEQLLELLGVCCLQVGSEIDILGGARNTIDRAGPPASDPPQRMRRPECRTPERSWRQRGLAQRSSISGDPNVPAEHTLHNVGVNPTRRRRRASSR